MWPDIRRQIRPVMEPDSVIAVRLHCTLMMCIKLRNLRTNCSVLMSVIWFVLLSLHTVMYNTGLCLFERQLMLVNDLKLTGFDDTRALMLFVILTGSKLAKL